MPIDLTGKTNTFTLDVPLDLPSEDLLVLNGENSVRVEIGLGAQIIARQIDNVEIETIGVPAGASVTVNPPTVSVILAGPFDTIQGLTAEDIQAVIDVNGQSNGSHSLTPQIILQQGRITPDSSQVLPASVTVTIEQSTPAPSATPDLPTVPLLTSTPTKAP
jgi:hypothetical protein